MREPRSSDRATFTRYVFPDKLVSGSAGLVSSSHVTARSTPGLESRLSLTTTVTMNGSPQLTVNDEIVGATRSAGVGVGVGAVSVGVGDGWAVGVGDGWAVGVGDG